MDKRPNVFTGEQTKYLNVITGEYTISQWQTDKVSKFLH